MGIFQVVSFLGFVTFHRSFRIYSFDNLSIYLFIYLDRELLCKTNYTQRPQVVHYHQNSRTHQGELAHKYSQHSQRNQEILFFGNYSYFIIGYWLFSILYPRLLDTKWMFYSIVIYSWFFGLLRRSSPHPI